MSGMERLVERVPAARHVTAITRLAGLAALVRAGVNVTMGFGRIESVDIVEHECLRGGPAEVIVEDVVEQQSLEVDTVSGATASSKTILKSIEVALSSAPRR